MADVLKMRDFRGAVVEAQRLHVEARPMTGRYLDTVYCGDPPAENQATHIDAHFLLTSILVVPSLFT